MAEAIAPTCANCDFRRWGITRTPDGRWCEWSGQRIYKSAGCEEFWPGWILDPTYRDRDGYISYKQRADARAANLPAIRARTLAYEEQQRLQRDIKAERGDAEK